ncbi:hypothetical protein HETIRDRAFT_328675 [Heterobasidion irregulare TC 32-1]|uniref:Uncharacterized protein n=1 Tax=Heterobasidion irregulare (strain TC 32-1) TaxID=747525 RepID=W4JSM0_HETIT|nr:uncharacterized protein HETIRDRAFT_328675 [Heterobasidion irregulare TC 32-1]ETW76454.1 hypothetical protein HETIRDRAFT_328675 [Heterobasidion irregulare TC 32-1]
MLIQRLKEICFWTQSKLDAWDTLDNLGNYDKADLYYWPNEGGDRYQGYDY